MGDVQQRLRAVWRPLAALALAIGLIGPAVGASEVAAQEGLPEIAAAAPESTVILQTFDLDLEGSQWQQTETLLARVGVPNAIEMWREEILAEGERSGDITEADLDALFGGEMAIIVTDQAIEHLMAKHMTMDGHMDGHDSMGDMATPVTGTANQAYGVAAVLMPGDREAAWDYATRQITDYAQERGLTLEAASGPGQDLLWTTRESAVTGATSDDPLEEMFGHKGHGAMAVGHSGDFIIAAKTPDDVTSIMDVIDGNAPSLMDSDAAQALAGQLPAGALAFTYFDGQSIVDSLDAETKASLQQMMPEMPEESWGAAGWLTISADTDGFRMDALARYADDVDTSSFIVPNDPAIVAAAEEAPAGTFIYQAGILPASTWAGAPFAVAQAVNAAALGQDWEDEAMKALPSPEEIEAQIATATQILGFDPAADLFDLLGDEFIAFAGFPGFGAGGLSLDAVAAISTTDSAAMAETMQKIAAWIDRAEPSIDVSVRRIGDDTVYVVRDPETVELPSLEFGVVDGQVVFSIGEGIAELNADPANSLADDAQFQAVMGTLPGEYSQVAYVDIGQAMGLLAMFSGEFGAAQVSDADLACAEFASQEQAQEALDADPVANSDLDLNGDGIACEDAFGVAGGTPVAVAGSLENIRALAMVTFEEDGASGTSAILYIAEPGS